MRFTATHRAATRPAGVLHESPIPGTSNTWLLFAIAEDDNAAGASMQENR